MANKVEIVFNADGSRAIRAMQEIGATARATGEQNAQAARAMATAAKLAGDTVSAQSIKIIEARQKENIAAADYAKLQTAVRKGTLDEATGVTALAAAYQRLTAAKLATAAASKVESAGGLGHTYASLRENIGGLRIGEILPETLGAAAGIAAMAEAASKLKEAVSDTLEFAEAIQRASEKTGLAVETLSTLHYAAATTGGDFEGMTNAVAKMDRTIAQATEGNKTASAFLRSLGLNAKELASSPDGAEKAFTKFAQTLAATENPILRVQLATGLLGRAGAEQIPTLIQLGQHWQEYADGAERTGTMLNGTTLKGLIATKEKIEQMHQSVLGVEVGLTEGLTPALEQMLAVVAGGKTPMDSLNEIGKNMGIIFAGLGEIFYTGAAGAEAFFAAVETGASLGTSKTGDRDWAASDRLISQAQRMHDIMFGNLPPQSSGDAAYLAGMGNAPKDDASNTLDAIRGRNAAGGGFGGIGDISGNPDEKKFKAMKDTLEQQKMLHGMSLADEESYWQKMLATTSKKKDPGLYALITPEVVRSQAALFEKLIEEWKQGADEAKRFSDELSRSLEDNRDQATKADEESRYRAYSERLRGMSTASDVTLSGMNADDRVRMLRLGRGGIGDDVRAQAAMHEREYQEKLRGPNGLNEQLNAVQEIPQDATPEQKKAQSDQIDALQKQIAELNKSHDVMQAEDDQRIRSTTLLGGANDALAEFVRSATDAGATLKQWFGGSINSTNDAILKYLTEPASRTHGAHIFGQAGHEIFSSAAGSLLKYGEGSLMKGLGIGGKADGSSESTALWVRLAKGADSGASSALSKLFGGKSAGSGNGGSDPLSQWLKGGSGGSADDGGEDDSSEAGAGLAGLGGLLGGGSSGGFLGGLLGGGSSGGFLGGLLGGGSSGGFLSKLGGFAMKVLPFIPGFAEGVDDFGGGLAMVGEGGPEIVNLPRGASVVPNRTAFGGGGETHNHNYNVSVDARGANDPAMVEAAVNRGIYAAAPHIAAMAIKGQREMQGRLPSSRR